MTVLSNLEQGFLTVLDQVEGRLTQLIDLDRTQIPKKCWLDIISARKLKAVIEEGLESQPRDRELIEHTETLRIQRSLICSILRESLVARYRLRNIEERIQRLRPKVGMEVKKVLWKDLDFLKESNRGITVVLLWEVHLRLLKNLKTAEKISRTNQRRS